MLREVLGTDLVHQLQARVEGDDKHSRERETIKDVPIVDTRRDVK